MFCALLLGSLPLCAVADGFVHVETDPSGAVVYLGNPIAHIPDFATEALSADNWPSGWQHLSGGKAPLIQRERSTLWIISIAQKRYIARKNQQSLTLHPMLGRTPLSASVSDGAHEIHVEKAYFEPFMATLTVHDRRITAVQPMPLKLKRGYGGLTVISKPLGTEIHLNGALQDSRTPAEFTNLSAGLYTVHLRKGKLYWVGEVLVDVAETTVVVGELANDDIPPGADDKHVHVLQLDDGLPETSSPQINLRFHIWDETGVQRVGLSHDADSQILWSEFPGGVAHASVPWSLLPGEGPRKVYVRFEDLAGNVSRTHLQRVYLTPPAGMVFVQPGLGQEIVKPNLSEPVRTVVDLEPFYVDQYEVTNQQYRAFVIDHGYAAPSHWKNGTYPPGHEHYPVVNVSAKDASEYAKWAGKRLPRAEEWEYVALDLGGETRWWPWGDTWSGARGNVVDFETGHGILPVDAMPKGANKELPVYAMAGNAWEWVVLAPADAEREEAVYALRGGVFFDQETGQMSSAWEVAPRHADRACWIGFRCVRSVSGSPVSTR